MEPQRRILDVPLELAQHIVSFCTAEQVIFVLPRVSRTFNYACRVPLVQRTVLRSELLRCHLKPDEDTPELRGEEERRQAEERVDSIAAIFQAFAPCSETKDWSDYWYRWLVSLYHLVKDGGTEAFKALRVELESNHGQHVSPNLAQLLHRPPEKKGAMLLESLLDYLPFAIVLGVRPSDTSSMTQESRQNLLNILASFFFNVPNTKGAELRQSLRGLNLGNLDIQICIALTALILQQRHNPGMILVEAKELDGKSLLQLTNNAVGTLCARNDLDNYWGAQSLSLETLVAGLGILVGVLDSHHRENKAAPLPELNGTNFPFFSQRRSTNKFRHVFTATKEEEAKTEDLQHDGPSTSKSSQFKGDYSSTSERGSKRRSTTSGLSRGYSFVRPEEHGEVSSQCFKAYSFMPDKLLREDYGKRQGQQRGKLPSLEDEDGMKHEINCRIGEQGTPWCYQVTAHDTSDGQFIGMADRELWVGQMSPLGVAGIVHIPAPNRRLTSHLEEGRGVFWLW